MPRYCLSNFAALFILGVASTGFAPNVQAQDNGSSPDELVVRGDALLLERKEAEAQRAYREALRLDDGNMDALLGLARAARRAGEWEEIVEWTNRILERDEGQLEARYLRAIGQRELAKFRTVNQAHHWSVAEQDFEYVVQRDSLFEDVLYQYGELRRYQGAHYDAVRLGRAQVQFKPDLQEPQAHLFRFYRNLINSASEDSVLAFLASDPSEYAQYFRGEKLRRSGKLEEADAIFAQLAIRPAFPRQRVLLSRARVHYAQNKPEAAENFVKQAIQGIRQSFHAALVFDDFKYVLNEQELELYYTLRTPEEFKAYFSALWVRRDPTPARAYNVRLAEHYRRVLKAEQDYVFEGFRLWHNDPDRRGDLTYPASYGLNDEFNDKGLIFIRHGEPDLREVLVSGGDAFVRTAGDANLLFLPSEYGYDTPWRPSESWRYVNPKMDFHFTVAEGATPSNWRLTPEVTHFAMLEKLEHWGAPYSDMIRAARQLERSRLSGTIRHEDIRVSAGDEVADLEAQIAADTLAETTEIDPTMAAERSRMTLELTSVRHEMVDRSVRDLKLGLSTDRHTWESNIEPIEMPHVIAAFRGEDGHTKVEVHYALPIGHISEKVGLQAGTVAVELGYAVHDAAWNVVAKEVSPRKLPATPDRTTAVIDFFEFSTLPDSYHVSIYGRPVATSQVGGQQTDYRVPDFSAPNLAMSDLLMADLIEPASGFSRFDRNGLHVSPNPLHRFSTAQPVYVYFEVYNLSKGDDQRARYSIDFVLTPESAGGGLLGRLTGNDKPAFTLHVDQESMEDSPIEYAGIDVSSVEPGRYTFTVRLKDEQSGQVRERSRPVELYRYK